MASKFTRLFSPIFNEPAVVVTGEGTGTCAECHPEMGDLCCRCEVAYYPVYPFMEVEGPCSQCEDFDCCGGTTKVSEPTMSA